MDGKNPFLSKTMIAGAIGLAVGIAKWAFGIDAIPDVDPATVAAVMGGLMLLLRTVTSKPLKF